LSHTPAQGLWATDLRGLTRIKADRAKRDGRTATWNHSSICLQSVCIGVNPWLNAFPAIK
jgi:hypothetical protein